MRNSSHQKIEKLMDATRKHRMHILNRTAFKCFYLCITSNNFCCKYRSWMQGTWKKPWTAHQFNLPPHCIKQINSAQTRVSGLICEKLATDLRLPVDGIPSPERLEANSRKRSLVSLYLQIHLRTNYTIDSTSMQQKERDKSDEEGQRKDRNGTEDATTSLGASTSVTACSMSEVSKPQTGGGLGNRLYLVGPLRFLS